MAWIQSHRSAAVIVGATLLLPLSLLVYGVGALWGQHFEQQRQIDRMEPRIARMLGVMENEELLRQAYNQVDLQVLDLVYPQEQDRATVSADLQKNVRDVIRDSGLSVTNSQVLPVKEREGFDYISLKLTVSGELAALDIALAELAEFVPMLMVESVDVWPARAPRGRAASEQKLTATMQLLSLRVAE